MSNGLDEDEKIGDQLRAKINGKFQAAIFLGGFGFTILSIQLTILYTESQPLLLPLSIGSMIAALMLYLRAIFLLDSLTMPRIFWERVSNVQPSNVLSRGDLGAMKGRMIFYWVKLVLVAIGLTSLSLFTMVIPPLATRTENRVWWTLASSIACVSAASIYCWYLREYERRRAQSDPEFKPLIQVVD